MIVRRRIFLDLGGSLWLHRTQEGQPTWAREMSKITYKPRYATRNDEIVARLRDAAGAAAPLDPKTVIKRKAAEISAAMALLHGGDWKVRIDHQEGVLMIARRGRRQTL